MTTSISMPMTNDHAPAYCHSATAPFAWTGRRNGTSHEVRYVSANGGIRWQRGWVSVSTVCIGEYVGLEEIDDRIWNVYFGALRLGRPHDRHMKIEDAYGRLLRHAA